MFREEPIRGRAAFGENHSFYVFVLCTSCTASFWYLSVGVFWLLVATGSIGQRRNKFWIANHKSQRSAMVNDNSGEDDSIDGDEVEKSQDALKEQRERRQRSRRRDAGTS